MGGNSAQQVTNPAPARSEPWIIDMPPPRPAYTVPNA